MKKDQSDQLDRRQFFGAAGKGVVVGVGAVVAATGTAEAAEEPAETGSYRETEHVKTYYKLARF